MKIASIDHETGICLAVALEGGELFIPSLNPQPEYAAANMVDLKFVLNKPDGLATLKLAVDSFLRYDPRAKAQCRAAGALVAENTVTFAPPIPNPTHFIGCGASYRQHLQEMGNVPEPAHPVIFQCSSASLTGHLKPVYMPATQGTMLDYEGELAIIMGGRCYGVKTENALEAVAGYTIHNDVSARDHVGEVMAVKIPTHMLDAWGRNVAAKQHPTLSPMGPYLITRSEVADPHALKLTTRVNGVTVQNVRTDDLIFTVAHYVAYVSQWYPLEAGDIISTGSPGGVGIAKKPPVFLKEGDRMEVSVSGFGTLTNSVTRRAGAPS